MNFSELSKSRKSVRGFLNKPIPKDIIEKIINTAKWAPSSFNTQTWKIHVVGGEVLDNIRKDTIENIHAGVPFKRDFAYKEEYVDTHKQRQRDVAMQLFEAMGIQREDKQARGEWMMRGFRHFDAPVTLILSYDKDLEPAGVTQFCLGSLAYGLVLAAWEQGVGAVINGQGVMQSEVVHKHANIPDDECIMVCIAMGYPDDKFAANDVRSERANNDSFVKYVGFDN